ncbi:MAG: polysaccharide pyruvyl transferase family protein [Nanoarchaeota archaeon]|nr:polysaccharide pyruvyl transferase family protein [Nanoarchaeota archaeon]
MILGYYETRFTNFGDQLSQVIIEKILNKKIKTINLAKDKNFSGKLLSLGSIFHYSKSQDTIWGTGINPYWQKQKRFILFFKPLKNLDIRAVRGPLTRKYIQDNLKIDCPEVYGDPALLIPSLFPKLKPNPKKEYGIIPHVKDIPLFINNPNLISPSEDWKKVVKAILKCKFIISSSLHGLIVAEAFGIPARWLHNNSLPSYEKEGTFKYNDYYASTNRSLNDYASTIDEALKMKGKDKIKNFNYKSLLDSFPYDKFK